ncbi:MAG: helix-turn-helix transcriptional regulator [Bacteroidota bacterium]
MRRKKTLENFYSESGNQVPESLKSGIGHFNVFKLDEFAGPKPKPMPFNRRDYFKVSLVTGKSRVHYADKIVNVNKHVLVFSNPQIPYNWEQIDEQLTGYFCVFTEAFFHQFGNVLNYPIFQPNGTPVLELSDTQVDLFATIFKRMFTEIDSDYAYKYDILRNLVSELIHAAMKLQPANLATNLHSNASERISTLFTELLERQFPIENAHQRIQLRSPAEFAKQLGVHINHLNRALNEIALKSTSTLIAERIVQEAKILIRHTNWNISEIGYSLGFEETAHFSNFFKKHTSYSPLNFRKVETI